jgi:hypothetical protein
LNCASILSVATPVLRRRAPALLAWRAPACGAPFLGTPTVLQWCVRAELCARTAVSLPAVSFLRVHPLPRRASLTMAAPEESTKMAVVGANTRFYEKEFPDVEECVVVNVRSIAEMGAYVHLLEYNNTEGMILLSELSRRRIRSINKLIRVGKNEVVMVIRVDKDKGEC